MTEPATQEMAVLAKGASALLAKGDTATAARLLDMIGRSIEGAPTPVSPVDEEAPPVDEALPASTRKRRYLHASQLGANDKRLPKLRAWVLQKRAAGEEWVRIPEVVRTFKLSESHATLMIKALAEEGILAPHGEKLRGRRILAKKARRATTKR